MRRNKRISIHHIGDVVYFGLNNCVSKRGLVTHLDETSHMSAEFVFRYGPKCMGGLILPILVLLHL